jgi:hypothetical protein
MFENFYAQVQIVTHNKECNELAKPFVFHIIVKHTNTNRFVIWKSSRFTKVKILKFKKSKTNPMSLQKNRKQTTVRPG